MKKIVIGCVTAILFFVLIIVFFVLFFYMWINADTFFMGKKTAFSSMPIQTKEYVSRDKSVKGITVYYLIANPPQDSLKLKELMLHFADTLAPALQQTDYHNRGIVFYEKTKNTACFATNIKNPYQLANIYLFDQEQDRLGSVWESKSDSGIIKLVKFRTDKALYRYARDSVFHKDYIVTTNKNKEE